MIDEKLLAEIEKTLKDAQFGYGSVSLRIYSRHVRALTDEVKLLNGEVAELRATLEAASDEASK